VNGLTAKVSNAIQRPLSLSSYLLTPNMSWAAARAHAVGLGGNLVTIEDAEENAWLDSQFSDEWLWIGLSRPLAGPGRHEDMFKWIGGGAAGYANWDRDRNQPDNTGGEGNPEETVVAFWMGGKWHDYPDSQNSPGFPGIVEFSDSLDLTLREPISAPTVRWEGPSFCLGPGAQKSGPLPSLIYALIEDQNGDGQVSRGDAMVIAEYDLNDLSGPPPSVHRREVMTHDPFAGFGVAAVNLFEIGTRQVFVGEPDGTVTFWLRHTEGSALEGRVMTDAHRGKQWHAMFPLREPDGSERLLGLRVDPLDSRAGDLFIWSPTTTLPQLAEVRDTLPAAIPLPSTNSLSSLASLQIRIWDGEGNEAIPNVQFQLVGTTNWSDARLDSINGIPFSSSPKVTAPPGGVTHTVLWDAARDLNLGPNITANVLLRARAHDYTLVGTWSVPVSFVVQTTALDNDLDDDGLPDDWERTNLGSVSEDPDDDHDADGFDNLNEYLAGTDPKAAESGLRLNATLVSEGIELRWDAEPIQGVQVRLERRESLASLEDWQLERTSPEKSLFLPTTESGAYFRLRLVR